MSDTPRVQTADIISYVRYIISTWISGSEVHYTEQLTKEQLRANLLRSGEQVCSLVFYNLENHSRGSYLDFDGRPFLVESA